MKSLCFLSSASQLYDRIRLYAESIRLCRVETIDVKMIIGFFSGLMVSGLLLLGIQSALPIRAQTDDTTANLSEASANLSQGLADLLPDIEKIYREALLSPLREAEKKIYDEDIAQFYHTLLEKTALDGSAN